MTCCSLGGLTAKLHAKVGNETLIYNESPDAAHPSETYGIELAPQQVDVGQFHFDVPQDAEPKWLAVYDTATSASASAATSPAHYDIGDIDLTKDEPQGPQPQEIPALHYEYLNMTAWERAYELFAQESKARVSEQEFVSKSQQNH